MKCAKKIVITAYKVQYVDLREEKPRTPRDSRQGLGGCYGPAGSEYP